MSAEYKSKMERRVREEALRLGITDVDMAPLVAVRSEYKKQAKALGFRARGSMMRKEDSANNLVYMCRLDTANISINLTHIEFFIAHKDDEDFAFETTALSVFVPGAGYARFYSPETAVLSVRSKMALFNVLSESF